MNTLLLLAALVAYPEYPAEIERDSFYSVRIVQGAEKVKIPVYNHCEKSMLTGRTWGGDVNRRFCEFAFDGAGVRVDIAVRSDVTRYKVFPSAKRFRHEFLNGVISVYLDRPDYFGVQVNDLDKTILSVFADPPETDVPAKDAPGVMFVDKWFELNDSVGVYELPQDVKELYIAPGAVFNARLVVKHPGVYIHGRGMMLDPQSDIMRYDQTKALSRGFLAIRGTGKGTVVDGIKLIDSRTFNICAWADDVKLRNVKELASMMCSDGFTNGGRNLLAEHCWLYVGDNALVVSGVKDAVYRDLTLGTSCKAIFPQGTNRNVLMEDINVFRADEAIIANEYNGGHLSGNKWNELNAGLKQKMPDAQNRPQQGEEFFFRRLSGVDQTLSARFFVGRNMGVEKPKTFAFENCAVPYCTGRDSYALIGKTDGVAIRVDNNIKNWLISSNFVITATNLWFGGEKVSKMPAYAVKGAPGELEVNLVTTSAPSPIPVVADVRTVDFRLPERMKKTVVPPKNLLEERLARHSIWARSPSYMTKLEATERDEKGAVIYHLAQNEKGAGMLAIVTEDFLATGNGRWRLTGEVRLQTESPATLKVSLGSNERRYLKRGIIVPNDDRWHPLEVSFVTEFELDKTGVVGLNIGSEAPADHIRFRNLRFERVDEPRLFPITAYGAKQMGSGKVRSTDAIAAAMDAAATAGGGLVVVPKGEWLSGKIHFKSNCELHLQEGANLYFVDFPEAYLPAVPTSWEGVECLNYSPLVYAYGCTNVAITGTGSLRPWMSRWTEWFARPPEHMYATECLYHWCSTNAPLAARDVTAIKGSNVRPHLIQFNRCRNVRLEDFHIEGSPFWTMHLYLSADCVVRGVSVKAHGHNNDGIDIEMTRNVLVEGCHFDQGDDAVVIKAGRNQDAWRLNTPSENIEVRACDVVDGHVLLGIGSEMSGGVRNVYMHDCTMKGDVKNVFYLKTNERRGGFIENIRMEDCQVAGTAQTRAVFAIATDVVYQWAKFPTYEVRPTVIRNISARNVSCGEADYLVKIVGDARQPVDGVTLENVTCAKVRKDPGEIAENVVNYVKR